jgi:1,4-dihydroxy-2-naphthoyl-CoA hydrolase
VDTTAGTGPASVWDSATFEAMLARGLTGALGFRAVSSGPDEVVVEWTTGPEHLQPLGLGHDGAHATAVETVASIGAQIWYGHRGQVVGVSSQTDVFRPGTAGVLRAAGRPIHRGRTQQVWSVEITDAEGGLVSRGQVRLQNLPATGVAADESDLAS